MYKKRTNRVRTIPPSRSAQITVFMILGLLILFVFIFVFSLSAGVKKGQLQEIQEKTLTKTFKKEALRIFVEDCLTDELEKGLILIGKQGRLWSDQPGGTRHFEEGISGVNVGNDRVFYGTIRDPYLEYENAYPCSNESSPEEFCKYSYPNTKVGFGSLELRTSTIQNDLRRFLLNRTVWCVAEFTKENISSSAVLESQEIDLNLGIHDAGIDVKVNYPLKLSLGNEEFFHLSQFDFFYPTRFKALLDTAVSYPLRMDWQYVDFSYNKTTLLNTSFTYGNEIEVQNGNCLPFKNYFFCQQALFSEQYASLGMEMSRQALPNGDDMFIFKSSSVLNTPELYTYQFARQNRPPALDYVHRSECPAAGYDYLVIKGDKELGIINLTLSALDPDEDRVSYNVLSDDFGNSEGQSYARTQIAEKKEPYTIRTYARDEHAVQDWQDVRVLIDRPLEFGVSLFMAYKFRTSDGVLKNYNEIFPMQDAYLVSREDPSFLKVAFPENSFTPPSSYSQEIRLIYANKDGVGTENFDYKIPEGLQSTGKEGCFSFPGGSSKSKDCTLNGYKNDISAWSQLFSPASFFPHFREATKKGELNLSFSAQYCARFDEVESEGIKVVVNDCVPHRNPEHPWAYPNHDLKYVNFNFDTLQGDYDQDEEINPFEATHSCCIGVAENPNDWQIAGADYPKPCFIKPEPGCYGQVTSKKFPGTPYTSLKSGYVLEVQQQFCSGNRGNICDGEFKNELKEEILICGNPGQDSCSTDIEVKCAGLFAFGYSGEGEEAGWCHGNFGCSDFCQEPVAYTGPPAEVKAFDINKIARDEEALDETDIYFSCGCTAEGQICDSNFNGKFNGVCQADNSCAGDA
ncbi:MAG: hypothetical protein Q7S55_01665 [Nanoarchaeota archaeon]|nr:hypothetical protein [Nanoarchaeota archaeon]